MKLNVKKTKEFTVSFLKTKPSLEPLTINNRPIEVVHTVKLLGVQLSSNLKWNTHIDYMCSKASKRLFALRMLKRNGCPSTGSPFSVLLLHPTCFGVRLSGMALFLTVIPK
jgi:hypothetical protein